MLSTEQHQGIFRCYGVYLQGTASTTLNVLCAIMIAQKKKSQCSRSQTNKNNVKVLHLSTLLLPGVLKRHIPQKVTCSPGSAANELAYFTKVLLHFNAQLLESCYKCILHPCIQKLLNGSNCARFRRAKHLDSSWV